MIADITKCSICNFTYVEKEQEDAKRHRSYHQQYLYITRRYASEIINPRDKVANRSEGYSLIGFGSDSEKERGAEMVLKGEFTDFLFKTHRYISFKEFLANELNLNDYEINTQKAFKSILQQYK